jgi:hypothetical protein
MKIRITGGLAEVTGAVQLPGDVAGVTGVSRPYQNRNSLLARACLEAGLPQADHPTGPCGRGPGPPSQAPRPPLNTEVSP